MFHSKDFRDAGLAPMACLRHRSGDWPIRLQSIAGGGVAAASDAPLLSGEEIELDLPGIGAVAARVGHAGRRDFTATFSGSASLRLRFLGGWRAEAATR